MLPFPQCITDLFNSTKPLSHHSFRFFSCYLSYFCLHLFFVELCSLHFCSNGSNIQFKKAFFTSFIQNFFVLSILYLLPLVIVVFAVFTPPVLYQRNNLCELPHVMYTIWAISIYFSASARLFVLPVLFLLLNLQYQTFVEDRES